MNKATTTVIAIMVVILLAGGIYYYKSRQEAAPASEVSRESSSANFPGEIILNDQPAAGDPSSAPNSADMGEVAGASTSVSTSATSSVGDSTPTSNFNASMKNARDAFLAKDYKTAIRQYNQAIKFKNDDRAYAGLFIVYGAQNDWKNARISLDKAIALAQTMTDYWKWKIGMLDEKTNTDYVALKATYTEGLSKVDIRTKINLMTYFAGVAESNGQKQDAIAVWQSAIDTYSQNKAIYQAEIDRLKASL